MKWKTIKKCRGCRVSALEAEFQTMFDLGMQVFSGIFPAEENEHKVPSGPLTVIKCLKCSLVQLAHDYPVEMLYGESYGYRSGLNQGMVNHLETIVQYAASVVVFEKDDVVIDIGSNDGTLLRHVLEREKVETIGIDPLAEKFGEYYHPNTRKVPKFFSADVAKELIGENDKAKAVFSIAMFYDLPDPTQFAKDVASILHDDGVWCVEVASLSKQIKARAFDGFCQEHLIYYTLEQLLDIASRAGFKPKVVWENQVNGGSVFVAFKKETKDEEWANPREFIVRERSLTTDSHWKELRQTVEAIRINTVKFLRTAKANGRLVLGYGASTKGNVLLQHFGISKDLLPAIAEVNEDKFGKVTPGTSIPIISEVQARDLKPDCFLVLPWHFRDGIIKREIEFIKRTGCTFVFPLPRMEYYPSRPSWTISK